MKRHFIILFLILSFAGFSQSEVFKDIQHNFKINNIKTLSNNFNNSLKIRVLDDDGMYSKSQAESVISNFMKKKPISDFQIIHQGVSKEGGLYYAVCKYFSGTETFRVYILLKQNGSNYLIDTIDFSKE